MHSISLTSHSYPHLHAFSHVSNVCESICVFLDSKLLPVLDMSLPIFITLQHQIHIQFQQHLGLQLLFYNSSSVGLKLGIYMYTQIYRRPGSNRATFPKGHEVESITIPENVFSYSLNLMRFPLCRAQPEAGPETKNSHYVALRGVENTHPS